MHVKRLTGGVQPTVSKNVCKQNVKLKPIVSAHFYIKLEFGSVNTSIKLISNSGNKHRPEPSSVLSHKQRNVTVQLL